MSLSRRDFLAGASGLILGGCCGLRGGDAYSVAILGDTHFDAAEPSVYHAAWRPRDAADKRDRDREFARNGEMWQRRLPALIRAAADVRRDDTAMLLHMGDMIQGDAALPDLQYGMLCDAERACRRGLEDLPFHMVCGNHDIRSAVKGFDRYLPQPNRLLAQGPDAYVLVDFMRPDPDLLARHLAAADGARHVFVVSHGLLAPHDGWGYYWFLFGKKKDTELRRHFRHEFAKRNVIALGGHIHRTALMDWRLPEGRITQFAASSVWTDPRQGDGKVLFAGPAAYGSYERQHPTPMGEEHDGCHQNRTHAEALALFDEYRPGLERYSVHDLAGHYVMHVGDTVGIDVYAGDSRTPLKRVRLR